MINHEFSYLQDILFEVLRYIGIMDAVNRKGLVELQRYMQNENMVFEKKAGDTAYEGHMFPLFVTEQLDSCHEKEIRERTLWSFGL
ncbi:hypothetical protein HAX54_021301 [Datura stramonium]|uniref:Uncharacterized protein n=1 Tax=Datura stramonium TaxID=4076 RepID=A0ABS8UU02_DATST|nr:hypothetical protein [Datura stramonium]